MSVFLMMATAVDQTEIRVRWSGPLPSNGKPAQNQSLKSSKPWKTAGVLSLIWVGSIYIAGKEGKTQGYFSLGFHNSMNH